MVVSVLGVMGVLIALTVWARYDPDRPGLLALDLVLGAAAWLGSPLLLWRPVGTTLVLTALAVLSPAVTPPATLGTLQVAERRRFPVAVAVGAAGVLAHLVQGAWRRPVDELPYVWWAVLCVIAYGALVGWGALVQARRALIDSLWERARRAEAEQSRRVAEARMLERTRIAREMHDVHPPRVGSPSPAPAVKVSRSGKVTGPRHGEGWSWGWTDGRGRTNRSDRTVRPVVRRLPDAGWTRVRGCRPRIGCGTTGAMSRRSRFRSTRGTRTPPAAPGMVPNGQRKRSAMCRRPTG